MHHRIHVYPVMPFPVGTQVTYPGWREFAVLFGNCILLPFLQKGGTLSFNNHFFEHILPDTARFVKGTILVNRETNAITKNFRSAADTIVELQILKCVQCIVMNKVF